MENAELINQKSSRLSATFVFKKYIWFYILFPVLFTGLYLRVKELGSLGIIEREMINVQRIFDFDNLQNLLGKNISTNLYYFMQYLFGKIFGFSVANMRIFSILLSTIGIILFYLFAKEWFNKRMAQVATFLISISSFHILISRSISHEILFFVLTLAIFYYLTLAFRQKRKKYFLVSGALIGLSFYASELTFSLVLLFLGSGFYFYKRNRKFVTAYLKEITTAAVVALFVALPFFATFVVHPNLDMFTYEISTIEQNIYSLFSFFVGGQSSGYMYNIGNSTLFDPLVISTFVLGIVFCCLKIKRRKYYFLLGWFVVGLAVLTFKSRLSAGDLAYILPVIFIVSAITIDYILSRWLKTFPFNRGARASLVIGIGFFFGISFSYNFEKVFYAWSKYPYRKFEYNVDVLKTLQKQKSDIYIYKPFADKDVMAVILNRKDLSVLSQNKLEKADKNTLIIVLSPYAKYIKEKYPAKYSELGIGRNLELLKGNGQ